MADLHFFYDVVCPFAYIASQRVEDLARRAGARLHWHPVLLGGIYRAVGGPDQPSQAMNPAKALDNARDMLRQAELAGVRLEPNHMHPQRSVEAMRLLVAAPHDVRPALTHALFAHYHVHQGSLDRQDLAPIAKDHGVDPAVLDDPGTKQALFDSTEDAVSRGAFGVPTFVVGDKMWWGADRLEDVAEALGQARPQPSRGTPEAPADLVFFHDFASPFSYLASTQVETLAADTGATLSWAPMLLGAVFHTIGTPLVPIAAMSEARRRWMGRDLRAHAARLGVKLRWPDAFPLHTVAALRVSLLEPAAIHPIYTAAWVHNLDIGQPDVLRGVLDDAGLDGAALLDHTSDPVVKQSLKDSTTRAVQAGVCGAPSFLVNHDLLFWGSDRLEMVRRACLGWRPAAG